MAYDYRGNLPEAAHNVIMEGREKLTVSGVEDVDSFDESEVTVKTVRGRMIIRGEALKLEKLSLDTGEIIACGKIDSLEYDSESTHESGGFFARLFS
ncbi:MAG: sporulation protein YabP [Ruminococcaceae bacterium]|nr:sporulation protein YabP [Oscillospiraceae bacterium]